MASTKYVVTEINTANRRPSSESAVAAAISAVVTTAFGVDAIALRDEISPLIQSQTLMRTGSGDSTKYATSTDEARFVATR